MSFFIATIFGKVIEGKKQGNALGFPTANIKLSQNIPAGVYVGRVLWKEKKYPAAIFIDTKRGICEAHMLHFSDSLYGEHIFVEIGKKLRDPIVFQNDDEAKITIQNDIQCLQELLKKFPP